MGMVIKEAAFEYSGIKQSSSGIAKPFGENDRQNIAGFLYNGKRPAQNFGLIRPTTRPSTGNDRQDVLSFINQNKRPAQTLEFYRPINLSNQSSGTQSSLNPLIYKGDVNSTGYNYVKGNPLARGGQQSSAATFVRKESIQPAQTTTIDRSQFARSGTATSGTMSYQGTQQSVASSSTIDRSSFARSGTGGPAAYSRSSGYTSGSWNTSLHTSIPYQGSIPQPVWQSHSVNPLARAGGVVGAAVGAAAANTSKKDTSSKKKASSAATGGVGMSVGGMGGSKITFDIEVMLDIYDELEEIVLSFTETILPAAEKIAQTEFYVNGSAKDACQTLEQVVGKTSEILEHYSRSGALVTKAIQTAQKMDADIAAAISARYSD
ncbi:hypothetical protein [uncultured Enterococcus sp.]|uniref:hypothetical protein n=1 Tax=uncultured Enterococcus sp. TaxID=167972 RepID=UPI002AA8E8EB|nr:hypothetical protein [uncultured Enterococcus sp.]